MYGFEVFLAANSYRWVWGQVDAISSEYRFIRRRKKKPDRKILFFRGEISISILRRGENFLVIRKLKKIPTKNFGRDFLKFPYNFSPLRKTEIEISPRKINIFWSSFFLRLGIDLYLNKISST